MPTAKRHGFRCRIKRLFHRRHHEGIDGVEKEEEGGYNGKIEIEPDLEEARQASSVIYEHSPEHLAHLLDPKNPEALARMGGVDGIARALACDLEIGLSNVARLGSQSVFGLNVLPTKKAPSLLRMMWDAFVDKTLLLLTAAACISLAIGIYQDVKNNTITHWIEGAAILVAVVIVVFVNAINDFQREIQFTKLYQKSKDRLVSVLSEGKPERLSIFSLAVGDVVLLEPGEIIPADGIYIQGHNLLCDESGTTGESDAIKKGDPTQDSPSMDPFFLSGTKVIDGTGSMLVIAVGERSFYGRMMLALQEESSLTPLQLKLAKLADSIAKTGAAVALLMFLVLMIKYIIQLSVSDQALPPWSSIMEKVMMISIEAITIVVVAVPEGLPMAVTLALAYATKRMLDDNNLVRVMAACETMGNATTICSDKTGTLTENKMTVVRGVVADQEYHAGHEEHLTSLVHPRILKTLNEAIAVNSTAFESHDPSNPEEKIFIGSKTEAALLAFTRKLGQDYEAARQFAKIIDVFPFASERKSMTTAIESGEPSTVVVYCKGASEIVLERCTRWLRQKDEDEAEAEEISSSDQRTLKRLITEMAELSLRTIAIAMRNMSHEEYDNRSEEGPPLEQMTLIALLGIEDPLRPGVAEAVTTCQRAGIFVRMVTGDNIVTAQSIARKCGILMRGGTMMEGPRFRQLSDAALEEVIPRLQVLARSSPLDKQILVRKLKEMGEVVAVTGDGTNDGPALKAANVGFAMGIAGTEVAKEASSIVLLDDNFASIVKAVSWGRCVNDSVRKFLQFQLTVNVSAVLIAFISSAIDPESRSVLTAVQLLWVNLIMDTFAALALATDRPTPQILHRHPEPMHASLISVKMLKLILSQSLFQVTTLLMLLYFGKKIFHLPANDAVSDIILSTVIFNTFVFMQLFNEINSRILNGGLNPFCGILRNRTFLFIFVMTILVQIVLVTLGGRPFSTVPLPWHLWMASVGVGALSLPIALIVRLLPDWKVKPTGPERIYLTRERLQWQAAIGDVRRSLAFFNAIRRARNLKEPKPLAM